MLKTKRKLLATLVAFTLVMTSIMPNVALALESVEDTQPTTKITETEPAASTKSTKKPESSKPKEAKEATEDTTKATSESTKATSETTKKQVEITTKATEETKATEATTSETTKTSEETKASESTPKESTETSAETASTTETSETKETKETAETTVETSESSSNTVPLESTTEESKSSESTTEETIPTESGEVTESSDPIESTESTESTEPTESTEETEPSESSSETSEPEETEFNQSITVDGIKITVTADKGVFPNGAELTAKKVENNKINKEDNVVASMTFDIAIMLNGEEIEPDTTKGQVKVTFFDERFEDKNLDAAIYHTSDDKKTEELKIKNVEGGAEVTTDGFSLYTVEFTYEDMKYTLTGYASAPLKTILEKVGLTGEVTDVKISNEKLVRYENGYIFAVKAFSTKEWMKVTINDITYIITLTDSPDSPEDATAGTDAYAILYDSGKLVFQKGQDVIGAYGTKQQEWLVPTEFVDNSDTTDVDESIPAWCSYAENINKIIFVDNIKGITSLKTYFKGLKNITTISNIDRLDVSTVTTLNALFMDCSSITILDLSSWNTAKVTDMCAIFNGCSSLKTLNLSGWNFRGLNYGGAFSGALNGCTSLKTLDLSSVKMPVKTYDVGLCLGWHAAGGGINLDSIDVSNIDLTQTKSLYGFLTISAKQIIGLTTWDVSRVECISSLFNGNNLVENIDISGWDLRNMTNTNGSAIFSGCANLKTLNMSNVKMPADTGASNFQLGWGNIGGTLNSINVTNLDLSNTTSLCGFLTVPAKNIIGLDTWDTSNVTNFNSLFNGQKFITELDLSNFTFKSGDTVYAMCASMPKLTKIILPASYNNLTINEDNNISVSYIWTNVETGESFKADQITSAGTYERILGNDAYVNTNAYAILYTDGTLIFQNNDEVDSTHGSVVQTWEVDESSHPWTSSEYKDQVTKIIFANKLIGRTSAYYMFSNMSNLTTIENCGNLDTSNITTMNSMFYNACNLTSIDVSDWDTSKVTNFRWMFGCDDNAANNSKLVSVIGAKNLIKVAATAANAMFNNNYSLKNIDTSNWNMSNITNTSSMFAQCDALTSLNTTNWNMSNNTNMYAMFYDSNSLKTVDISNWNISSNMTNTSWSFTRTKVTSLDMSNWNMSNVTDTYYMFGGCNDLTSVKLGANWKFATNNSSGTFGYNPTFKNSSNEYVQMSDIYSWDSSKADTYIICATVGENAYALLYGDGYLVFQKGPTPDPNHGELIASWAVKDANYDWTGYSSNIKYVDFKDEIYGRTSTDHMFNECVYLNEVYNAQKLDMSQVTNMSFMFAYDKQLTKINGLEQWKPSNCTEFNYAFGSYNAEGTKLTEIDMSNWQINEVHQLFRMFENCSNLRVIDLSGFNCVSGYACDNMVNGCKSLSKIILPESIAVYSENNRTRIGLNSSSQTWLKDGTTVVDYQEAIVGGTYEKILNVVTFKKDSDAANDVIFYITETNTSFEIPDELKTLPNNTEGEAFIGWYDGQDNKYTNENITRNTPSTLYAKFGHAPQDAIYGDDLYKLLYIDANNQYVVVYQKGNTPTSGYGTFVSSTLVTTSQSNEYVNGVYTPVTILDFDSYTTNNYSNMPTKVVFRDRLINLPKADVRFTSERVKKYENLDYIDMSNATGIRFSNKSNVYGCSGMATWNTTNITNMYQLFYNTKVATTDIPNLSNWNTSNVTNLSYAFYSTNGEVKGLESWNTSNVTDMSYIFYSANMLNTDSIKDWNVSKVKKFKSAFSSNTALLEAELNWDMRSAEDMSYMFDSCYKLSKIKTNKTFIATANTNNINHIFYCCDKLTDITDLAKWDVSNVTDMSYAFANCNKLAIINALSGWDVSNVTTMKHMFSAFANASYDTWSGYDAERGPGNLVDLSALSNWQTSSLTDISFMFYCQAYLNNINGISGWDVSHVTDMTATFCGLSRLTSLEALSSWTTSSLTKLCSTFKGMYALKSVDGLENWDVTNVTDMSFMLDLRYYANSLRDVSALSNWHANSLNDYRYMLYNCNLIPEVDFSNWDLSRTGTNSRSDYVFNGCDKLIKITLPANFVVYSSSSYGTPFNSDWIYTKDNSVVNLQTEFSNWTVDKAGTYIKNYYVSLYPMGGTVDPTKIETNLNQSIDELPTPVRDGYNFLGWFDSEGTLRTSIPAGEYITSLFAQWESKGTYTLVLDPNINGYEPYVVELKLDEKFRLDYTLLNIPDSFEFSQWTERKSGDGEVYTQNQIVVGLAELGETVTIYAQWITHSSFPVKMHAVNILTGERTSLGNVDVRTNEYFDISAIKNIVKNKVGNTYIYYASYRNDLDCVHFEYNEEDVIHYENQGYNSAYTNAGKSTGEDFYYTYDRIKDDRGQFVNSSHMWTLDDFNNDIYVYYIPALKARVWFNKESVSKLPVDELIMTVDGKQYKSGEYVFDLDNSRFSPSARVSIGEGYVPSAYANARWEYYTDSLLRNFAYMMAEEKNYSFNYPVSLNNAREGKGCHKSEEATGMKYSYLWWNSPNDIMDISITFDLNVVYDFNNSGQYAGPSGLQARNLYTYYSQYPYSIDNITQVYGITAESNDGYIIEGWYTAPEGGTKVYDPNAESYRNPMTPPIDFSNCPVVDYSDKLDQINNDIYVFGEPRMTQNKYVTLYAHWVPKSEYNASSSQSTFTVIHINDSHNPTVTEYGYSQKFVAPNKLTDVRWNSYMDDSWSYVDNPDESYYYDGYWTMEKDYAWEKDPIEFEDHIFGGWYTEPNGQGTKITKDMIITETGDITFYAYWKKPTEKINFSLETNGDHPTSAEIKFSNTAYSNYYYITPTTAYIYGADTVAGYMIPYAMTDEEYDFIGWYDSNNHKLEVGDTFVDGATYYAKWEKNIVSVEGIDYDFNFTFKNSKNKMKLSNPYISNASIDILFKISHTENILPEKAIKIYIPTTNILNTSVISYNGDLENGKYYRYDNPSYDETTYNNYNCMICNAYDITGSAGFTNEKSNVSIEEDGSGIQFYDADGNIYKPGKDYYSKVYKSDPIILTIDTNGDGTPDIVKYKYLYIESDPITGAGVSNFDNININGYITKTWNSEWGEEPADASDYLFVTWQISNTYLDMYDRTQYYNNQDMYFFANTKLPITSAGQKVYNKQVEHNGENYEFAFSVLAKPGNYSTQETHSENNTIVMKYPKSQFSYDAQLGEISQQFEILVSPRNPYINGQWYEDTVIKTGKVTWSWAEGSSETNGRDMWANMGRFSGGYVSSVNSRNTIQKQRQYAVLNNTLEMEWYSLYAQRIINGNDEFSVSVKPGDFSYASGASENCYMWQPATGRTDLSTYDYCITGIQYAVFNGYSEKLNDGYDPNVPIYVGDIQEVNRNKYVEIYVMYRGSNTWTLLDKNGSVWSAPSNLRSYNDGHVNVQFNRGYSRNFDSDEWEYGEPYSYIYDTRVVGVKVKAKFETGSNYQAVVVVPKIKIFPSFTTQDKVKMDFDQEVKSAITMTDFTIDGYKSNASYRKGQWSDVTGAITDLGLTTWYLTSDVTDLDLRNNIKTLNLNTGNVSGLEEGDAQVVCEVINQAQNSTYYKAITSGDYYVLLPENTSLKLAETYFAGTSYANSSYFTNTDINSWNYGGLSYDSMGGLTPEECSVETIENWENSGRTMVIYHLKDLTKKYTEIDLSHYNSLIFKLTLHRENEDIYGINGDVATLFVDKSGTFYINRREKYENAGATVHEYFSNLNSQNAAKERSMAYAYADFTFYTEIYNTGSGNENMAHQDGFNDYVANSSNQYTNNVNVFPGENYTYKVLWSQSGKKIIDYGDHTDEIDNETNNAIIYTRLDGVGVFKGVYAPAITGKVYLDDEHLTSENVTVTPTIWYCKDPNFASINNFADYDLSTIILDADHGWYTSANLDSDAKVYGMAFDYSKDSQGRDVYLAGDKFIGITIYQQNLELANQTFNSESRISITNFNSADYGGLVTVNVAIPDLKIDVVSNPASGTATNPTAVRYEQDLVYTWTVHNREDRAINDVIVSFKVPDATTCTLDKIKVGNISITDSIAIKNATLENGIVTLTIKTLSANEDFVITENTYVSTGENGIMITNQGFINGYNGIIPTDTQIDAMKSDITYHITLTMPEPTGIVLNVMPYALIFGAICVTFFVSKKTLKKKEEEE